MRPNESLFFIDPPITTEILRPGGGLVVKSSFVRVPEEFKDSWLEQNMVERRYLLTKFDATTGREVLRWFISNVDFPISQNTDELFFTFVLQYDTNTRQKSWMQSEVSPLQRFINHPFDITHTLSGGGLVTHSTINTFTFIR